MINIKKGTALSLKQSDKLATAIAGVTAGMVVSLDVSNPSTIFIGVTGQGADNLVGFAINNSTDGDVISVGKIGIYVLDGNSVIETDQVTGTINATNFPVGNRVAADGTTGAVKLWASGDRVLGYVDSIRSLPSTKSVTQNYTDVTGATVSTTQTIQNTTALLGIKLAV